MHMRGNVLNLAVKASSSPKRAECDVMNSEGERRLVQATGIYDCRALFASESQTYRLPTIPYATPFCKHLAVAHFNLRDISSVTRFADFKSYLDSFPFSIDVCGISESWTTPYTESFFAVPGYKQLTNSRSTRTGGGVILYLGNAIGMKSQFK